MAKAIKGGVEYFTHCTNASSKKTISILQAKFGNDGYAFWFRLLEAIGEQEGHFLDCRDDYEWYFLAARTYVSQEKATEILALLSDIGAIDKELWDKKVIWVQKFVDRLEGVYKKRKCGMPQKPVINAFGCIEESKQKPDFDLDFLPKEETCEEQAEECAKTASEESSSALTVGKLGEEYTSQFEEFWEQYPPQRRIEKKSAFKCWKARIKSGVPAEDMITAAKNYNDSVISAKTDIQFIKHAKTFLGVNEPYKDYLVKVPTGAEMYAEYDE